MKKLFLVLAILFIGILLAGCTSPTASISSYSNTDAGSDCRCTSIEIHC